MLSALCQARFELAEQVIGPWVSCQMLALALLRLAAYHSLVPSALCKKEMK